MCRLSWTELFLLCKRNSAPLFPHRPASLHKYESLSEPECDITVSLPFEVNPFNLFTISCYFLSPPFKWSFLLPLFWWVRYYQLIWRVSLPFISYYSHFSNCNFWSTMHVPALNLIDCAMSYFFVWHLFSDETYLT